MIEIYGQKVQIHGSLLKIARLDAEKFLFLDHPEAMIEGLRMSGSSIDIFTFIQKVSETSPIYNYPIEWDNLAVLPVSTFDHWWNRQIGFKARNKARQAEKKGIVLREVPFDDFLVQGIWEIYNETPIRQGKRFPHFGKDRDTLRKEMATYLDRSVFIGAMLGDKLVGFAKLIWNADRCQAGLLHIVSLIEHRDKAPTNALVAYAVRYCAGQKIPYLVYSNFAYGKRERDSLSDFKERNGFNRVDLPRYYVPLTALGWVGLRLSLHRKVLDRVPEPIIQRFRELRRTWYERKLRCADERT